MSLDEVNEIWALPIVFDSKDVFIQNFKIEDKYVDKVFSLSYKDNIAFKFKDFLDLSEYSLKLFDNNIKFEGQVPLVIYSHSLDLLLEVEKEISFEFKEPENVNLSNDFVEKNANDSNFFHAYYEFGEYINYLDDDLKISISFKDKDLIIEADIDNMQFLKRFISDNFDIDQENIIIRPLGKYWTNVLFPISFNAVIQGIIIAKRTSKKVNVMYYKRHFLMVDNTKFIFSAKNYLRDKNKLSSIDLDLEINRPLSFLNKYYIEHVKRIFNDLFFEGFLNINFIQNSSNTLFFYDNLLSFETSVYNFIYSNIYNIAISLHYDPVGYLITQVKGDYNIFLKLFKKLDAKTSVMRKSSALSLSKDYNIFESRKKGLGLAFFSFELENSSSTQVINFCMYKDKLDVHLPYNVIDNNLKNHLKSDLAKTFNFKYENIDFIIFDNNEFSRKKNNLIQSLVKEPYLIEKAVFALKDKMLSMLNTKVDLSYPIALEDNFNIKEISKVNLLCSIELEVEFHSFNIIISNVNFFINDGKFSKLNLNTKRAYTILQAALDYVFGGKVNISYENLNFLNLEFIEDGEFIFSFRPFFIASVSAIRVALIQAFDFNIYSTPLDFKEILNSWSIKIDFN